MRSQRDAVRELMRNETGDVCAQCVGAKLDFTPRQVIMILLGLARTPEFEVVLGTCGRCQEQRHVIRARPS
jgi:hypothetical protein